MHVLRLPGEQQGAEDYTDGSSRRLDQVGREAFSARTRCAGGRATRGRRRRDAAATEPGHQQSRPRARVQVTRRSFKHSPARRFWPLKVAAPTVAADRPHFVASRRSERARRTEGRRGQVTLGR